MIQNILTTLLFITILVIVLFIIFSIYKKVFSFFKKKNIKRKISKVKSFDDVIILSDKNGYPSSIINPNTKEITFIQ